MLTIQIGMMCLAAKSVENEVAEKKASRIKKKENKVKRFFGCKEKCIHHNRKCEESGLKHCLSSGSVLRDLCKELVCGGWQ